MKVFGKDLKKEELLKRVGDLSQVGGIKMFEFIEGSARGVRAADIKTPSGIDMTVVLDRGMDISSLTYQNIPISWRSVTRETSPYSYEAAGLEWLRTFFGGLLTTCGLDNIGGPCTDEGEELGLHGRISNLAAERVCHEARWEGDTVCLRLKGAVRQTKVFGEKLELRRQITAYMDSPRIVVEDEIENLGFEPAPMMVLYHINIGYPVIDEGSRLLEAKAVVKPRDEEAEKGLDSHDAFSAPIKGFKEQVFFHDIQEDREGNGNIALVNEGFQDKRGLGIWLRYSKKTLPHLIQWKQMGEGEYVCGIEPSNSLIGGRAAERQAGDLPFIGPGQVIKNRLELTVLGSNDEIAYFKKKFC